jgi:hypothetical protein
MHRTTFGAGHVGAAPVADQCAARYALVHLKPGVIQCLSACFPSDVSFDLLRHRSGGVKLIGPWLQAGMLSRMMLLAQCDVMFFSGLSCSLHVVIIMLHHIVHYVLGRSGLTKPCAAPCHTHKMCTESHP